MELYTNDAVRFQTHEHYALRSSEFRRKRNLGGNHNHYGKNEYGGNHNHYGKNNLGAHEKYGGCSNNLGAYEQYGSCGNQLGAHEQYGGNHEHFSNIYNSQDQYGGCSNNLGAHEKYGGCSNEHSVSNYNDCSNHVNRSGERNVPIAMMEDSTNYGNCNGEPVSLTGIKMPESYNSYNNH